MSRIPRTPISTLFPYTTLFRSLLRDLGHDSDIYALTVDDDLRDEVRSFSEPAARAGDVTIFHFALDRKSTRLNSSHSQISYAVFCLKKKNRGRPRRHTRSSKGP